MQEKEKAGIPQEKQLAETKSNAARICTKAAELLDKVLDCLNGNPKRPGWQWTAARMPSIRAPS